MHTTNRWTRFAILTAVIVAAGFVTASPASAANLKITCTGPDHLSPLNELIPSANSDVTLKGTGWCTLPAGNTINGNVKVTKQAQVRIEGIVNGNVEAKTKLDLGVPVATGPQPEFPFVAVLISGGVINGDVNQKGEGSIRPTTNATVNGNIRMKGTGRIIVGSSLPGAITITGNLIHDGVGCINVLTQNGNTVSIGGNVENMGDGGGIVAVAPFVFPGSSECTPANVGANGPGGAISVDGNICGVLVLPNPLLTVKGNVETSC